QQTATGCDRALERVSNAAPELPKGVALVVGNSNYKYVAKLPNPRNDARDIAAVLSRLGYDVVTGFDLTLSQFNSTLADFSGEVQDADFVLIYYGGHGIEVGGNNYLVPVDARLDSARILPFRAISLDSVLAAVKGARKLGVVFLDACRENPFTATMRSVG